MPGGRTPLDHALNSRNAFLAFTSLVAAGAAWSIWGTDMFPAQPDPTGDPATWNEPELRRWLTGRNLHPDPKATKEELVERVKANFRVPRA